MARPKTEGKKGWGAWRGRGGSTNDKSGWQLQMKCWKRQNEYTTQQLIVCIYSTNQRQIAELLQAMGVAVGVHDTQ